MGLVVSEVRRIVVLFLCRPVFWVMAFMWCHATERFRVRDPKFTDLHKIIRANYLQTSYDKAIKGLQEKRFFEEVEPFDMNEEQISCLDLIKSESV